MKPICECHNESSLLHHLHWGCANGFAKEKKKKRKEKNPTLSGAHDFMMMNITDANECADGRAHMNEFRAGRGVTDRLLQHIVGNHIETCGYEYDRDGTDITPVSGRPFVWIRMGVC